MPSIDFGAPQEMYVRTSRVHVFFQNKKIIFDNRGTATFDTFFNGLTIGTWKKSCTFTELFLILKGAGKFILRFGLHRTAHAQRWLDERVIELQEGTELVIDISFWQSLEEGMFYFCLESLGGSELTGGYFATKTPPINKVKLGIVITHFNRKQYVLPAIKRIRDDLLTDPVYKNKIELVVVDNSKSILPEEAEGTTLIPNKNLGGSGGFTRGLLHLKDEGSFTHCLFMDDDASCEVESIRRCYHLLEFSSEQGFSVSGCLMRETQPFILHEKGAEFHNGFWEPSKRELNLTEIADLLYAEREDVKINFGAWWFFAFKISDVNNFAFPFFIRGDDVQFSLQNNFKIKTINGIGCWAEDFWYKESPITKYFVVRASLVLMVAYEGLGVLGVIKNILRFFSSSLLSYNYASAKSARLALIHFMMGPKFWLDNMDMNTVRKQVSEFSMPEKLLPIDLSEFLLDYPMLKKDPDIASDQKYIEVEYPLGSYPGRKENFFRKAFRILTLNGFFLPSFLLKKKIIFQHKAYKAFYKDIFLYEKVLYEYVPTGLGYIAVHNKKKFFSELFSLMKQLIFFIIRFKALRREYKQAIPNMTSEEFWRKIYFD